MILDGFGLLFGVVVVDKVVIVIGWMGSVNDIRYFNFCMGLLLNRG